LVVISIFVSVLLKFQVPQFIETETKLIGPLTLKQFLWVATGGAILFFLFLTANRLVFFIAAIPIGGLFAALAFIRLNNTPLMSYVLYAFIYIMNPKQYIFKKEAEKEFPDVRVEKEIIINDNKK